ncbi:DUF4118 domain-containing protein [Acidobacteria bacterium AB60]|nr:DUF4118 domain-containing protein [Acidobacteria bacterium AB60]
MAIAHPLPACPRNAAGIAVRSASSESPPAPLPLRIMTLPALRSSPLFHIVFVPGHPSPFPPCYSALQGDPEIDGEHLVRTMLKTLAGIAVCAATAFSLTVFLRDGATIRLAAPAICIQVVIIIALFWGRTSAFIGAIIAGMTFALFLYPPYGHLWIRDPAERVSLTLFELAALCVVLLSPAARSGFSQQSLLSFWQGRRLGFRFRSRRPGAPDSRRNPPPSQH